jgi:outer membrane immunogenic protein
MVTLALSMDRHRLPVRALPAACFELLKKILIAIGVVAVLLGGRTLAADLPPPLLPAPVPKAVPSLNWSGPYFGIGLGGRANAVDANVTSATVGTPPTPIPLPGVDSGTSFALAFWQQNQSAMQYLDHIAIHGTIYGGWNFQVAPAWVIGVEADFGLAHEKSVFHGSPYPINLAFGTPIITPFGASPNDTFGVRSTWDASLRLRGGWLATPSILFYLTGGLAVAHLEATSTCSIITPPPTLNVSNCAPNNYFGGTLGPAVITHSGTKLGWTAGLGVDMWLWSNWMVRMHYRYADFGYLSIGDNGAFSFTDTRTCSGCPAAANPLTVSYQLRMMQHFFELGLAYKF